MNIEKILSQMTLEEKAGLCSGLDSWKTKPVERLNLESIKMSDGPHGLRTEVGKDTLKAVCFPSGAALASSFDREVVGTVAREIGKEAHTKNVNTVLGPAINIKRSPLCGRNFEYMSEDPYLAGELAVSYVKNMQETGSGTCLKHFAANSQEYRRMSVSDNVDERTLREIYLSNFEKVVKEAKPWSIMCSYNRINGAYSSENKWLLTDLLRKEWEFNGVVVSDWGAVNRRVSGVKAGLNIEMPSSHGETDKQIVKAVKDGTLDEKVLDNCVRELLEWIDKQLEGAKVNFGESNFEEENEVAKKAAEECAVLLKNDGVLPLNEKQKVAFIGGFAEKPRYQGGGSSHINTVKVTSALDAVKDYKNIVYKVGFHSDDDVTDEKLIAEAVKAAKEAEVAVIFAGLPDTFECEGYDRTKLDLPNCQNTLIEEVLKVQPNVVVVLHNGSPVAMPWKDKVKGILEMYLGGQAVGAATADLLFGKVNPSGRLAETFPMRIEDTPCYLDYPGDGYVSNYSEGIFVGYRYYDARKMKVLFPFGYGLSYTTFEFSNLKLDKTEMADTDTLKATVKVKNTGKVKGKETVQLYVAPCKSQHLVRAPKELKGFIKVELEPGEEKEVTFELSKRSFAYYETKIKDFYVPTGDYEILIGSSSRDIALSQKVTVTASKKLPFTVDDYTTFGDVMDNYGAEKVMALLKGVDGLAVSPEMANEEALRKMVDSLPLHAAVSFSDISIDKIEMLKKSLNQ